MVMSSGVQPTIRGLGTRRNSAVADLVEAVKERRLNTLDSQAEK